MYTKEKLLPGDFTDLTHYYSILMVGKVEHMNYLLAVKLPEDFIKI